MFFLNEFKRSGGHYISMKFIRKERKSVVLKLARTRGGPRDITGAGAKEEFQRRDHT